MQVDYRKKAIEASAFILVGYGFSQFLRLLSNLVLTRLLVPELFGIISTARVFLLGLWLFSDIGLEPAIIRSSRADDRSFLDTAWSMQVLRSVIIAAVSFIVAIPAAHYYKQPILAALVPVIGLAGVISGSQSTAVVTLDREMNQRRLITMDIGIQFVSLVAMIAAAYFTRSIWALLAGDVLGSVIRTAWSHSINRAHPNRFSIEPRAFREILSFGKWILLSTGLMFLATQSDRIMLGKLMGMAWFGVYGIAVTLAEVPKQIVDRIASKVLFPLMSRFSQLPRDELRSKIGSSRGKFLLPLALLVALCGCFGDYAVRLVFDQRYHAAAWIFPMLALGMWPYLLVMTVDRSLFAIGKPKYSAAANFAKIVYMFSLIPLSQKLGGAFAIVLAVALNDLPSYIVVNFGLRKERLSLMRQDALSTAALVAMCGILIGLRLVLGLGFPGLAAFRLGL